jgi:hypothetical protein
MASNLREAKRGQRSADRFGFDLVALPMGPFPLADDFGMKVAMAVLDRSLDPGRYAEYVQWETFRRSRLMVTNISQAGAGGLAGVIGAYGKNRSWISQVSTHSFWFSRFITGIHKRVGEIRKQDEPMTIEVLHAIDKILESEWQRGPGKEEQRRIAEVGTWVIGGFCAGLRGEEMLLIELAGTVNSLKFLERETDPYFMFVVSGRTKGNQLTGSKFGVPCIAKTQGTGIWAGRWVQRLTTLLKAAGYRSGHLFRGRLDLGSSQLG